MPTFYIFSPLRMLGIPAILQEMRKELYQYTVFIESCDEGGYFADCPSLPGCHVQGETLEDALKEMRGAIDAYLADLKSHREPIPRPRQVTIASIAVSA